MENEYIRLHVNNEEEQPQKPQRRSLWRHWKMLSRFQRNLVTLMFVAALVTVVYYWGVSEQISLENQKEQFIDFPLVDEPVPQRFNIDHQIPVWIPAHRWESEHPDNVQFLSEAEQSLVNRPDLKPMYEWKKEQEEEAIKDEKRRWEEEKKEEEEKRKIEEEEKRRKEEQERKALEEHRKRMEEEKKRLEAKRLDDLRKEQERKRLKEERRKEDERRMKEERERKEKESKEKEEREISDREQVDRDREEKEKKERERTERYEEEEMEKERKEKEDVMLITPLPGVVGQKLMDEKRKSDLTRKEHEEKRREEQSRLEEERRQEKERKRKEMEKKREEDRQKELAKMREEEEKEEKVREKERFEKEKAEEKRRQIEKRKEIEIVKMVANSNNIQEFRLKPVEFAPPGNDRQAAVVEMLQHAWAGYKKYAWGHDHLKPITKTFHDWFGLGLTIVDGLDTLWILGLTEEFSEARDWVAKQLSISFNEFHDVNLFEVTIRVLGGLLSAYHVSGDPLFLEKAMALGELLLPCFTKSPSAIPFSDVNLASHLAHSPKWSPDSSTSEVTTLQLEFRDLSRCCHDYTYEDIAFQVSQHVHLLEKTDGLVPIFINPNTGKFHENTEIKLGARGDSYYEYLLKQWIQTGKVHDFLKEDYIKAVEGIKSRLMKRTPKKNLLFIGELKANTRDFLPKMDHLVCFVPGMLALGVHHGMPEEHLSMAIDLMDTCYRTYTERPTGLAPEITFFNYVKSPGEEPSGQDMYVKTNDAHNLLRPEFIESLWYMWSLTGNTTYQDWGWQIFKSFERYTKVSDGYTSISNVNNPIDVRPRDMMESFFISETIKYLYLLFADDRKLIDVDKWVMNTEGHPLPIYVT